MQMRKFLFFMVAVLMLTSSKYALAQQTVIDGKVLSNTGAALSGATVKSGNISALTGGNGEFSIRVAVGASLTVSYVGYTDAKVSAAKGMTVTLQPSTSALDEVIVTGVASATSKKKMTVSVTRVGEERLSAVPAVSAAGALVGKVAGARVSMTSGSPGAGVDILLRGDNN
jgi:ribosomal 50S subunit-recycling heat shock protein